MSDIENKKRILLEEIEVIKERINKLKKTVLDYDNLILEIKRTDDYNLIKETGKSFGLKFSESSLYKKLCKEILLGRLKLEKKKAKTRITHLEYDIIGKKNDIEALSICPQCGGKGMITEIKYYRENGNINQVTHSKTCTHCDGTGKRLKV